MSRIEEIKEITIGWRAEKNKGLYWYLGSDGTVNNDVECGQYIDDWRHSTGNYFKTKKEAKYYKEFLEAESLNEIIDNIREFFKKQNAISLERGPFDWHKVGLDQPNLITIHMVKEMAEYLNAEILIVTGRDQVCRAETEEWLNKQDIKYTNLFMRPAGDKRKDTIVKQEIYRERIEPKYNVFIAFDDRPRVIKMYREMGVKVIDVGNGVDF